MSARRVSVAGPMLVRRSRAVPGTRAQASGQMEFVKTHATLPNQQSSGVQAGYNPNHLTLCVSCQTGHPGGRSAGVGHQPPRVKDYNEVRRPRPRPLQRLTRPPGDRRRQPALTLQTVFEHRAPPARRGGPVRGGTPSTAAGVLKRALRINPDAGYAIGIQLVALEPRRRARDLAGDIRGRARRPRSSMTRPRRSTSSSRLPGLVGRRAHRRSASGRSAVLGAGIGAPGPLDRAEGWLLNVLLLRARGPHFPLRRRRSPTRSACA